MPVTVRTFASSGEAAAALSADRGARYLGGGTLVMRAINEGDVSISTVVRATDHALRGSTRRAAHHDRRRRHHGARSSPARARLPARPWRARSADRRCATWRPSAAICSPHSLRRFHRRAAGARRHGCPAGRLRRREMPLEEFLHRASGRPARSCSSISLPAPASAEAFRFRKVARVKPKGVSVLSLAAHLPVSGGRIVGARDRLRRDGADADPRQGGRARARRPRARRADIPPPPRPPPKGLAPGDDAIASAWYRREIVRVHLRRLLSGEDIGSTMAKTALQFRHNGARRRGVRRRRRQPAQRAARTGRRHVAEVRLRPGHLRRLHRADRRRAAALLPDAGRDRAPAGRSRRRRARGRAEPASAAARLHGAFAAQCGFCTPGMLMAAKALLDRNPAPSRDEVVEAISGNICRCTGYEPIINAVLAAARAAGRAPEGSRHAGTAQGHLRRRARRQSEGDRQAERSGRTCSAMSPAPRPISTTTSCGHAAPEGGAQPASPRPHPPHRHQRGRARARRAPDHPRRRRAAQPQHPAQPDQLRQGRRAVARRRQGALQGRADRRRRRRQPSATPTRRWRRCGSTTSRCRRCSTSRRR